MRGMDISLSESRIAALRRAGAQQVAIEAVAETGSTNADLLARIDGLAAPTLLVAERQTAGRGRAGRSWLSAPGGALTFSLAWRFAQPIQALLGLPLAVGVALAEALALFDIRVGLKWPNDVLKDGKKLAGILVETAALPASRQDGQGGVWAVIGIGLNLNVPDQLEAQIGHAVADAPWLARLDRNLLLAELLNALADALVEFESRGFAAFVARWNGLHAFAGQTVLVLDRGQVLQQGVAVGVDAVGRLLLDTAAGRVAVVAGDVSLRIKEG
ncbi:biotin--[acetyl-CoA-carboxylase] ligase [Herminiimonas sp. CN]|uniref:biotin--[acetyl-CoA-carboxylase] ligase n=1 Tax=Herminiimonas sp. CN TaxID=1349818 RepID=UPI00350EA017